MRSQSLKWLLMNYFSSLHSLLYFYIGFFLSKMNGRDLAKRLFISSMSFGDLLGEEDGQNYVLRLSIVDFFIIDVGVFTELRPLYKLEFLCLLLNLGVYMLLICRTGERSKGLTGGTILSSFYSFSSTDSLNLTFLAL